MCGEHYGKSDFAHAIDSKQWNAESLVNYLTDTQWFNNLFLLDAMLRWIE